MKATLPDPNVPHDLTLEHVGHAARVVCTCGDLGPWRRSYQERGLHSDEGQHLHAVRRAKAAATAGGDA